MKNLIYKELKLASHPTIFIFLSFSLMLLIPSYPYYVAYFYTTLSLYFVFLTGRENKDVFYTVLLPIRKSDVVKARCWTVALVELAMLVASVPVAIVGAIINPKGNLAGIDANVALFGLVLIMFALFNIIFIPNFYKTGYKIGVPFVLCCVAMFLYIAAAESLVWIPSPVRSYLDTTSPDGMLKQLPVLAAGIVIWIVTMVVTYRKSASNFEKVDL